MDALNPHEGRFEPLPGDFEPELLDLDARLVRDARHGRVPSGLVDRVFRASAGLLPAPAPLPLRSPGVPATGALWGRLAMAASVGLAFVVGSWLLRAERTRPGPPVHVAVAPAGLATSRVLDREAEQVLFGADGSSEVGYLLETRDLTLDDLSSELAMLVAELEM
ncbi:MAG: hypothetical protein ACYTG1_05265 [Planctomycetota bacterium]|jgi:hypothetical protein